VKIIRYAVTHPVTIWMITLAAVVFGLTALSRLDLKLLPEIKYPSLTIQTEFPGTAPVDVENLVTRPLEEAVGVVPGLRKVHSISQAGLSQVSLEFNWGTAMDYAALDVREKIDLVSLPEEVNVPLLLKYDPALDPVVRLGLTGDVRLVQLRNVADNVLKKEIEGLSGVAAAQVAGGLEEEIRVEVDETRLSALGLNMSLVNQVLVQNNINASGGRLRDRGAEFIVRTLSRLKNLEDIRNVTLTVVDGQPVRLGDVAQISRTHKDRTTVSHIDGRESVEIAVFKEGDANIVEMAALVRNHLDRVRTQLPDGIKLEVLFDQSVFIGQAITEVRNNAMIGGLLAVLVLFTFLKDFRSTLIIGIAIPISIVATFILMLTQGVSLNIMSLGGLALGVGMLVDNSIVVLESIYRRRESAGEDADPMEIATRGASDVAGAVTASTLTTLAVFVPIVFVVVGVAGQIFRDQALTVTFALAVSLVVALTFTPMAVAFGQHRKTGTAGPGGRVPDLSLSWYKSWSIYAVEGRRFMRIFHLAGLFFVLGIPLFFIRLFKGILNLLAWVFKGLLWPLTWTFGKVFPLLEQSYENLLGSALKIRALVMVLALLVAGASIVVWPHLGSELVPPLARGEFTLDLELPEGTPLTKTNKIVSDVEKEIATLSGIAMVAGNVGVSQDGETATQRRKENRALVRVRLDESTAVAENMALEEIRVVLAKYPEVAMKLRRQSLMAFSAPVEVDVYGYNLDNLQAISDEVVALLGTVPGLRDVKKSMVPGSPEVQVSFDRDKLNRHGLRQGEVSQIVQSKVGGLVATRLRDRERHVDIRVLNEASQRNTLAGVQDLIVAQKDGIPISLGSLATMDVVTGPSEIHRLGNRRVAIISANLSGRDLGSVSADIEAKLASLVLPAGISVELGGQNLEMASSFHSLQLAILLAVFLVYLVMAAQFESFVYPLIIMFTVPLAMSGALFGLYLTGHSISVIAIIGGIMLAGIVVNNGIVLVDRINQLRLKYEHLGDAVVKAGCERLRPILMTTSTTVLGLMPMALGLGEGAELRAPLAITVIGGLLLSTLLTLVVVPVLYTLLTGRGLGGVTFSEYGLKAETDSLQHAQMEAMGNGSSENIRMMGKGA
jgi:hydrophobic/amphiphilic exporter-1 (mainly G- bacteria), HAE1 family